MKEVNKGRQKERKGDTKYRENRKTEKPSQKERKGEIERHMPRKKERKEGRKKKKQGRKTEGKKEGIRRPSKRSPRSPFNRIPASDDSSFPLLLQPLFPILPILSFGIQSGRPGRRGTLRAFTKPCNGHSLISQAYSESQQGEVRHGAARDRLLLWFLCFDALLISIYCAADCLL